MRHSGYPPRSTQISARDHLEQQVERLFSCSAFEQACEYFLCGDVLRVLLTQAAAHLGSLFLCETQRTFILFFHARKYRSGVSLAFLRPRKNSIKHRFYFSVCHVRQCTMSCLGAIMAACTLIGRMMIVASRI